MATIYNFEVLDQKGQKVSLSQYKGKVLLVVNTATKCGLTPQYEALERLYEKYHEKRLEILDFPCNQFNEQAPEDDEGINTFCSLKYHTTFQRFKKIDVNGENAEPLFTWLKEQIPNGVGNLKTKLFEKMVKRLTPNNKTGDIKWNFEKFLIDKEGKPVGRFSPALKPDKIEKEIVKLL
ncbi:MAG: glutathione peroxidase [Bacteroidales bacterium]|jgi:glutathione peroxidase|nr:glutathione peroxidase [Bacteroidales bacterium]